MTMTHLLIIAIAAAVVGFVVAVFGWRGRRLNDDPVCRKCRFNLSGSAAPPDRCPECGRGLSGRRAVRRGERRRRRWALVLGASMLIVGGGGIGVSVYVTQVRSRSMELMPEWWLLFDLDSTSIARRDAAFDELYRRVGDGSLSEGGRTAFTGVVMDWFADLDRPWDQRWIEVIEDGSTIGAIGTSIRDEIPQVAEAILQLQADPDRVWNADWGRRFEQAFLAEFIEEELVHRYLTTAMEMSVTLELPDRIHANIPLHLWMNQGAGRVSPEVDGVTRALSGNLLQRRGIRSLIIDGEPYRGGFGSSGGSVGFRSGGRSGMTTTGFEELGTKHVVMESWGELCFSEFESFETEPSTDPDDPSVIGRWSNRIELVIDVVPDDEEVVTLVDASESIVKMIDAMRVQLDRRQHQRTFNTGILEDRMDPRSLLDRRRGPMRTWRKLTLWLDPSSLAFCHRIFAVDGDREFEVGSFETRQRNVRLAVNLMWPIDSWVNDLEALDLEFRPDVLIAEQRGLFEIAGDEFRINDIAINAVPKDLGDPQEVEAMLRDRLSVRPRLFVLTDRFTSLSFEVEVSPVLESWVLDGDIVMGARRFPIRTIKLAPDGWVDDGTPMSLTTLPQYSRSERFEGELATDATLILRPPAEYELDFELEFGPFDVTEIIDDQRTSVDD